MEKTVQIEIAVCEILSRMHEKKPPIIHRDIKSENIVITTNGEIYLVDFGISREYDFNSSRDTQVMGTPAAAPPEQFGYGQTDERSDVYAVGVLLNELATGSVKINAKALPHKLSAIVKRCTEFAPEKSYKNAFECKKALLKIQKNTLSVIVPAILAVSIAAIFLFIFKESNFNYDPSEKITENPVSESMTEASELAEIAQKESSRFIEFDGSYAGDLNKKQSVRTDICSSFLFPLPIAFTILTK